MGGFCDRFLALLEGTGARVVILDVGALVEPDAATIDALAQLRLSAQRCRRTVRLRNASPELHELLALVGLCDVVGPCVPLGLEPRGQPEEREEGGSVQEEGDAADPAL